MELKLYKFSKKHNSTKQLANDAIPVATYTSFYLKRQTDIDTPVFIIDDQFHDVNYAYLVDIGRFYFIKRYRLGNNNIYELECEIDVLATYKSFILAYTAFVERCSDSNYYNTQLQDNALSAEEQITYSDSASTDCAIAGSLMYIVRILGREDTGGLGTYLMTTFEFQKVFSSIWGQIDADPTMGDLPKLLQIAIDNPAQYIVGVYSTPIGLTAYMNNSTTCTLYIGGHETDYTDATRITNGVARLNTDLTLNLPTSHYSDFRKSDPAFSQYTIYIPTIGTISIAPDLLDTVLTMDIGADLYSGDLLFTLKSDGDVVATYASNCYASVSIGTVNQAGSIFSGSLQTAASLVTGNLAGTISGIKSAMQPSPSVIGSQGGTGCTALASDIVITCQQKASAEFPLAVQGRPCCKNILLSNLTGYVKCGAPSVEVACNESVKNQINGMLESGFYIE